ncbi:MAG: methyl-accepting chemotaxis protein [bacterium]
MTEQKSKRRRSYIVNKNFQLRYIGVMAFLLLAATIMVGITIYYQMGRLIVENSEVVGIPAFLNTVTVTLLIWAGFIIALIVFFGLFISHRIAGPLKRLEDSIIKVGQGNLSKYAQIRKGDEFKELVDIFNKTVISLRQLALKEKDLAIQISKQVDSIGEQLHKDSLTKHEIQQMREELNKLMNKVNEIAADFKL